MARVRHRGTAIELATRRALHAAGLRYRLNVRDLPGSPDIVLPRWRAVVLVHGCFWHYHECRLSKIPHAHSEFWTQKLKANRARDSAQARQLEQLGWRIFVVWQCTIDRPATAGQTLAHLAARIRDTSDIGDI